MVANLVANPQPQAEVLRVAMTAACPHCTRMPHIVSVKVERTGFRNLQIATSSANWGRND